MAGRTTSLDAAQRIGREVTALWLNGPAGGGGARRTAREVIGIVSVLVPREQISPDITILTRPLRGSSRDDSIAYQELTLEVL